MKYSTIINALSIFGKLMIIKVEHSSGIKHMTFAEYGGKSIGSFRHFLKNCGAFRSNYEMQHCILEYKDDEGDWIDLETDSDLSHALEYFKKMLRVRIFYPDE